MPVSPEQAFRQAGRAGATLPPPFRFMGEAGWHFRRGWVTLVAAAPTVGKTALALEICRAWRERTLYIAADTDLHTMLIRVLAADQDKAITQIEKALVEKPETRELAVEILRDRYSWLRMSTCDGSPTLRDMDEEVRACCELWGDYPQVIVIDNLGDVNVDDEEKYRGIEIVQKELRRLARITEAAVITLHHVNRDQENGTTVPPRNSIQGAVTKIPEMVLTLATDGYGQVGMACVKNRGGPQDPPAAHPAWKLTVNYAHMRYRELGQVAA